MLDIVYKRHDGDGWLVFSELANRPNTASRYADAVALGVWASNKYELHLYEFKRSREDVKRELRDPTKVQGVGKYAHYWWLTISDEKILADLVVPEAWGIILRKPHGKEFRAKVLRKAPRHKPEPFNEMFSVAMIRNFAKSWVPKRQHNELIEKLYRLEHPIVSDEDAEQRRSVYDLQRELDDLKKKIASFEEASGVVMDGSTWRWGSIGEDVRVALELRRKRSGDSGLLSDISKLSTTASEHEDLARSAAQAAARLRMYAGEIEHATHCGKAKGWSSECSCGVEPASDVERAAAAALLNPPTGDVS